MNSASFFHVSLFEPMLASFDYPDTKFVREIIAGMSIASPVRPSSVWPLEPDARKGGEAVRTIDQILDKAWE